MKVFGFTILLCIFWISLSGYFTPLMLGLGLASVVLTVFLANRMNLVDDESFPYHLFSQLPAFFVYIFNEIIKANIDVVKRIITLKKCSSSISPQLIDIPVPQKTDLGRVIYANSITLTPGTVSVRLSTDTLTIHALTKEAAEDLAKGHMAKNIPDLVKNN